MSINSTNNESNFVQDLGQGKQIHLTEDQLLSPLKKFAVLGKENTLIFIFERLCKNGQRVLAERACETLQRANFPDNRRGEKPFLSRDLLHKLQDIVLPVNNNNSISSISSNHSPSIPVQIKSAQPVQSPVLTPLAQPKDEQLLKDPTLLKKTLYILIATGKGNEAKQLFDRLDKQNANNQFRYFGKSIYTQITSTMKALENHASPLNLIRIHNATDCHILFEVAYAMAATGNGKKAEELFNHLDKLNSVAGYQFFGKSVHKQVLQNIKAIQTIKGLADKDHFITFYRSPEQPKTEVFGNFYESRFPFRGQIFKTTEAMFQVSKLLDRKFNDPMLLREFSDLSGDHAFRKCAKNGPYGADTDHSTWHSKKEAVMREVTYMKYTNDTFAKWALLATGDALLIEHCPVEGRDDFWSDNHVGNGKNALGYILMDQRDLLRGLPSTNRTHLTMGDPTIAAQRAGITSKEKRGYSVNGC